MRRIPLTQAETIASFLLSEEQEMKVGILTGGGDCPGLNAVIRAIVRKGVFHYEDEFVGFLEGWRGLLEDKAMPLDLSSVGGILPRGGTILRTSRTNPAKHPGGIDQCIESLKKYGAQALIAVGGDDTLSVAQRLHEKGIQVVGVPKTIDNDLAGTDYTFGFDSAVHAAVGGDGDNLSWQREKREVVEVGAVVLGHRQRGGSPSAAERVLAPSYGIGAIDMLHRNEFGCMAALRGNNVVSVPLADAIA